MRIIIIYALLCTPLLSAAQEWFKKELPGTAGLLQLPFSYRSLSKEDKNTINFLGQGCYTVLEKLGDKVLVGPMNPVPLIVLYNTHKVLVANTAVDASLISLIAAARQEFKGNDLQKTGCLICVNENHEAYTKMNPESEVSWQELYQGRTQREEVFVIQKTLMNAFKVDDSNQIATRIFNMKINDAVAEDAYPTAELFVVVERAKDTVECFSICPIAEGLFGVIKTQSFDEQVQYLQHRLRELGDKNPYLIAVAAKQLTFEAWKASYGMHPFVRHVQDING